MNVISKINVDLQNNGSVSTVSVMQRDRYARILEMTLLSGGEVWNVPENASAVICYRKADGKGGEYDTLPDGTTAWTAEGNVLRVILAPQVVTTAGPVQLSVTILEGKEQISTFGILLDVQAAVGGGVESSEEYAYVTGWLPAPSKAKVGQFFRVSSVNEKGKVLGVEAVDLDALEQEGASDEELMAATYTLSEADFIHGIWNGPLDAGSDKPYSMANIEDKFCTRKIKTTMVPKMSYSYFTTPMEYVFWNDGEFAGKMTWAEISENWQVGFVFDEVGINFSWGWDYVGSEVIVRLTVAVAEFEKVLVIGDSISADYYGNYPKWVTLLIEEGFLPANTINNSVHATGFVAEYTAEGDVDNYFLNRINAVTDKESYDLVVVFGGINDFIQNIPMGESGGNNMSNFIPAVEAFFEYLVEQFVQARIVVLTPLRTYQQNANTAGHVQTEYAAYIKQTAKKYCLPVLDLTEESGFCPYLEPFKEMWTLVPEGYDRADGVHPNEDYQKKFLAPMIRRFLERFV